jgi:hypothetical protein
MLFFASFVGLNITTTPTTPASRATARGVGLQRRMTGLANNEQRQQQPGTDIQPREPLLTGWIVDAIFNDDRDHDHDKAERQSTDVQPREPLLVGWIVAAIFDDDNDKQHSADVQPRERLLAGWIVGALFKRQQRPHTYDASHKRDAWRSTGR